jgi:hypothetical protein
MDIPITPEHPWYVPPNARARVGERYEISDPEEPEPRVIVIEAADDHKIYWEDGQRREGHWLHIANPQSTPILDTTQRVTQQRREDDAWSSRMRLPAITAAALRKPPTRAVGSRWCDVWSHAMRQFSGQRRAEIFQPVVRSIDGACSTAG